ncbi:hypothetical protein PSEWESI4_03865 [Pseudomonas carbonaria]|uniref:Uncharacterized protein n=1 Tax=Zestomonas carbonaria TaxID=2762745 RepID=A0A7U7ER51_9GAMM|nr:hypothetical protein PSEWESI4_03865 [Pseudomonas carbonaria]
MNDQFSKFLSSILAALTELRCVGADRYNWGIDARAQIYLAHSLGIISFDQLELLSGLITNARMHAGRHFPSERNAGPVITWFELHKRERAARAVEVKPQAQVPANEQPESVSAPTTCGELRLLCLLVKARSGETRALPVHTVHPVPPRVRLQGRWPLEGDTGFTLRPAPTRRPSAEVVVRCLRQRQANAFRADSRAVRGLSHA